MSIKVFTAPQRIYPTHRKSIFLAGTIDMGASENWQIELIKSIEHYDKVGLPLDLDIYNPRRDDWDASWEQKFENPDFFQQVTWEMDALERAEYILFNFLEDSKSPITLLELGRYAPWKKSLVICPEKFYRRGNVEIFCHRERIDLIPRFNIHVFKKLIK